MAINTDQLRYFLSVARHRNFTEAAREHYISQPAITHQISSLERELGVRLFVRTTRSVTLSRAGELFLEDAKQMLDQETRALQRLRQVETSGQLELKIGYLNSPTRHFLPLLIREYRSRYPQVKISLQRRDAGGIQEAGEEEAYDLLFSVLSDLEGLDGYVSRKLSSDFYCIVCPKNHPCLNYASVDYQKLATESFACLSREAGAYMHKQFMQICKGMGFAPSSITEYPAMEDVIFSVECGQSIAILPYHIRSYMDTNLAFIPLDGENPAIDIGVAWKSHGDNPAAQWFIDLIQYFLVEQPELF